MKSILALMAICAVLSGCSPKAAPTPAHLPHATAAGIERVKRLPAPYNTGDPVAGRDIYARCAGCHDLAPGGSQDRGPILAGFIDQPAATRQGYPYSEALRRSGIVWDLRHLDQWLFNPRETLPGSSMPFIGIRNDSKRYDVLAYLTAISD